MEMVSSAPERRVEREDMRLHLFALMVAGIALPLVAAEDSTLLKSPKDKISYSIGMSIGQSITNQSLEVNPEAMAAGLKAVVTGAKPLLTDAEFQENMKAFNA